MRSVLLFLCLFGASPAWAAQAKIERSFHVGATPRQVEAWVVAHQQELAAARGFQIVVASDRAVRIKIISPLQEQEVTLAKFTRRDETGTVIGSRLLTLHSGDVLAYLDQIRLVADDTGTRVVMTSQVEVNSNVLYFEGLSDMVLSAYIKRKMDKAQVLFEAIGGAR